MTGSASMTDRSSRIELLRAVRTVQQAAVADDVEALHDELCRLRNALVEHIGDAPAGGASEAQLRLIRHGRRRLLRFIDDLLSTTHEAAESCTCLVRGAELRSLLLRQLQLEAGPRTPSKS